MEPIRLVVRATARLYQRISALIILSGAFDRLPRSLKL